MSPKTKTQFRNSSASSATAKMHALQLYVRTPRSSSSSNNNNSKSSSKSSSNSNRETSAADHASLQQQQQQQQQQKGSVCRLSPAAVWDLRLADSGGAVPCETIPDVSPLRRAMRIHCSLKARAPPVRRDVGAEGPQPPLPKAAAATTTAAARGP